MSDRIGPAARAARLSRVGLAGAAFGLACHRAPASAPASQPAAMPKLPSEQLAVPPALPSRPETEAPVVEPRVTIITGDHDMDVKQALELIARRGGYGLSVSPNVRTRVRLNLVDVPVSEALQAVLAEANLTLAAGNGAVETTWNPSIVFYQLPVNVDSLSVEAIMKRFSLSREMAEVIVKARRP